MIQRLWMNLQVWFIKISTCQGNGIFHQTPLEMSTMLFLDFVLGVFTSQLDHAVVLPTWKITVWQRQWKLRLLSCSVWWCLPSNWLHCISIYGHLSRHKRVRFSDLWKIIPSLLSIFGGLPCGIFIVLNQFLALKISQINLN